jgi:hypothetical protein
MIKGVNKQVLEINETQNGFFEKAIFFVKPEYSGLSEGKLKESARLEIERAGKPPLSARDRRKGFRNTLRYVACVAVGIIAGYLISSLL